MTENTTATAPQAAESKAEKGDFVLNTNHKVWKKDVIKKGTRCADNSIEFSVVKRNNPYAFKEVTKGIFEVTEDVAYKKAVIIPTGTVLFNKKDQDIIDALKDLNGAISPIDKR